MTDPEPHPTPLPPCPPFQFTLRTLLLLFVVLGSSLAVFVVLGSSLAVFGAWGLAVFGLVVGLAVYLRQIKSLSLLSYHVLLVVVLSRVIRQTKSPSNGYPGSAATKKIT
jgi:hypothetical protein